MGPGLNRAALAAVVVGGFALSSPSFAQDEPATEVKATGNPFSGGLGYDPSSLTVKVGTLVRWTNTDDLVPHTVTESNGLWELSGSYGPPGSMGFGPGESVERRFEASSFDYYCAVHGAEAQSGKVAAPVRLTLHRRGRRRGRRVVHVFRAVWASERPAEGQVFDVQVRRGKRAWQELRSATRETEAKFRATRRGRPLGVRARLRSAADPDKAAGWSPEAVIRTR